MGAAATPTAVDKRGASIRDMFAGVAPRYDLLNHLLSASLDRGWRRRAAKALAAQPDERILDLCAGTGDQALAIAPSGASIAAADFCLPMVALARRKFCRSRWSPAPLVSDALALPLPDSSVNGATVTFGLRNVADLSTALRELARVLRPQGRLVVLEFATPRRQPLRGLYLFYFRRLLPGIGRLLSPHGSAYSYLPASVLEFPAGEELLSIFADHGFWQLTWQPLAAGIVGLYQGVRV